MQSTTTIKETQINTAPFIKQSVTLQDKTWFQTGGPAKFYCEPTNNQEFKVALEFAKEHQLEIFILGAGANILISDDGFDGLVIRPQMKTLNFNKLVDGFALVTAGAGVLFPDLINSCLDQHVLGLEEFSGIPGTVGGATFINLHFFKFLLSQFLVSATVIHKQSLETLNVDQNWFDFGYNQSKLQDHEYYLLDATFKLNQATELETAYARGRSSEMIRYRAWRYPSKNTCGSFFRNFHDHEVSHYVGDKKMIFVAYYLDNFGTKGTLKYGDAIVSHQHANMLVNLGHATSQDIISVAREMQQMVYHKFGLVPQPECLLVGFKEYPLYTKASLIKP